MPGLVLCSAEEERRKDELDVVARMCGGCEKKNSVTSAVFQSSNKFN